MATITKTPSSKWKALLCKRGWPDNWQVRVKDLQRRGNLGRDGTNKLINELWSAGYREFRQGSDTRGRIRGGCYIVREIPNPPHPESPETDTPDPVSPNALPTTEVNLLPSTTTTTYNTKERYSNLDQPTHAIVFPDWVPPELQQAACHKVVRFDSALAQMLMDEWASALNAGEIKQSPLGYLNELTARLDRNQFNCHYADDSAQARAQMNQTFQ